MENDDAFGELTYEENFKEYENEYIVDPENIEIQSDINNDDDYEDKGSLKTKNDKEYKEKKRKKKTIKNPPVSIKTRETKRKHDTFLLENNGQNAEESVFNSISPLDWYLRIGDEELAAKHRRVEVENAVGQISLQILASRMTQKQKKPGIKKAFGNQTSMKHNEKEEYKLLELPPMDGYGWYGISSTDGNVRRYVPVRKRMRSMELAKINEKNASAELESYYEIMLNGIEEERNLEEIDKDLMECDIPHTSEGNGAIWTQKYAPKNFFDLLTNDETNRLVLLWLRLWQGYAFHRKGSNLWESMNEKERALMEVEHRKGGQILPKQKILVLYGSSGVGKSSLAQIAAKQAGFSPLILPMSELQNVTELRNRLENAINTIAIQTYFKKMSLTEREGEEEGKKMQKSSKIDENERPICFIVEGLELATSDMVHFLCNWSRRNGNDAIIHRPIICTCASIWQNATLKELRTSSLALRVQHCNRERLQKRLNEICRFEDIEIERAKLDELIQSHAQDIRLCLNTLQFTTANANQKKIVKQREETYSQQPNQTMNSAMSISLWELLGAIFTLDFHEDNRGIVRSPAQRARSLLNLIDQIPQEDFARLQQFVFTNFASILKLSQSQCLQIVKLFVRMDRLHHFIQHGQHFGLTNYLVYQLLGIHFVCAVHVSRRLQFIMTAQPFNERLRESQQTIRSMRTNAVGGQRFLANGDFIWLLPHLYSVLQPQFELMNVHLNIHRGQEQRQLRWIVQVMHSYRLQYLLKYGPEGGGKMVEAHFRFEPAFDLLVQFPLLPNRPHISLPESIKKFIAHQVDLASIKAPKHNVNLVEERNAQDELIEIEQRSTNQFQQHFKPFKMPSSIINAQPKANFTGSFTFRFSAGSSQAVRRRVLIGDIFK